MNKVQFLSAVREKTADLPQNEENRLLEYYAEMIDEAVEEGLSEEEAITRLGSWEDICTQINDFRTADAITEHPISDEANEKQEQQKTEKTPRKRISLPTWAVVLLILTSPVWGAIVLSLGIVVFAVIASLVVIGGALVISLFAVVLSLAVVGVVGIPAGVVLLATSGIAPFLLTLGGGLVCVGLAILGGLLLAPFAVFFVSTVKLVFRGIAGIFRT